MADTESTTDQRDTLPDPDVTSGDDPLVEVTFHENVQGFVVLDEDKPPVEIEPGKPYLVPATIAITNLTNGHALITGGETPKQTEKRLAARARKAARK